MKRKSIILALVIGTCCFYFTLSSLLLSYDNIPKWGDISHPEYVVFGQKMSISISYYKIPQLARLFVTTSFRNVAKEYSGQHHYLKFVTEVSGSGNLDLLLDSYLSGNVDQIKIRIDLLEVVPEEEKSVYRSGKLAKPLMSVWIPVAYDGLVLGNKPLGLWKILLKGYQTGYWKTNRGDYSLSGWMITFFYAVCCLFLIAFILQVSFANRLDKLFWLGVFGSIVLVSINKQLDFQMLITDFVRTAFKEYQLYETRKLFQTRIISLFATLGFGTISFVIYLLRKSHKSMFVALGGLGTIFSFLVLRLISYHKIEAMLRQKIGIVTVFDCFEIAGIGMVIVSLIWYYKSRISPD